MLVVTWLEPRVVSSRLRNANVPLSARRRDDTVGAGVDDRHRHVERRQRPQRVHLLPAVLVFLPHEADANAEIPHHRALDEHRGFVRVGVFEVGIDGRVGDATKARLQHALLALLIHAIVVQIVPDVVGILIGRVGIDRISEVDAGIEVKASPVGFDDRLAVAGEVVGRAETGRQVIEDDDVGDRSERDGRRHEPCRRGGSDPAATRDTDRSAPRGSSSTGRRARNR